MAHENEAVKRYDMMQYRNEAEMEESDDGNYVTYADHQAVVTRLRASAPKVWDAGNIGGAPDNNVSEYRPIILNAHGEIVGAASRLLRKVEALDFLKAQQEDGFGALFHGPIPQPPAGGGA